MISIERGRESVDGSSQRKSQSSCPSTILGRPPNLERLSQKRSHPRPGHTTVQDVVDGRCIGAAEDCLVFGSEHIPVRFARCGDRIMDLVKGPLAEKADVTRVCSGYVAMKYLQIG